MFTSSPASFQMMLKGGVQKQKVGWGQKMSRQGVGSFQSILFCDKKMMDYEQT